MNRIFLIVLSIAAFFAGCTKDDAAEFTQVITDPHTMHLSDSTITGSGGMIALTMAVTNPDDGVLFYAISNESLDLPSSYDLISGDVDALTVGEFNVMGGNANATVNVDGYKQYFVYSILRNVYNEITPVAVDTLIANDVTGPYLIPASCSPALGEVTGHTIVMDLVFSEPVFLTSDFAMEVIAMQNVYATDELPTVNKTVRVEQSQVSIHNNVVTIDLSEEEFGCDNYIIVAANPGSFDDASGNPSKKIGWNHNGYQMVSMDYYFDPSLTIAEGDILNFMGENSVLSMIDGELTGGVYTYDVQLQPCTENTVLLGGYFGIHSDVPFTFDFELGAITFEKFETNIYYDDEEGGFYVGTPETDSQYTVYFSPVDADGNGNAGEYSISNQTFYVCYGIYIDNYGVIATVVDNYAKNAGASTSTASVHATSAEQNHFIDKIKAFKEH